MYKRKKKIKKTENKKTIQRQNIEKYKKYFQIKKQNEATKAE